jgi:general secretion pathway protein A
MSNPFEVPLYLQKYGLKEAPFTTNPDERYLYLAPQHQGAINMIARIIQNKEGLGLVIGDAGSGKTTIMRRLYSLLLDQSDYNVGIITNPAHCPTLFQLAEEILKVFNFERKELGRDTKTRMDILKTYLLSQVVENQKLILFIDEAQEIPTHMFESIRSITNFEDPRFGKSIQIFMFGQPNIRKKLKKSEGLSSRLVSKVFELKTLEMEETEAMLRWRFSQAGGEVFPFDDSAINEIYSQSQGNPRSICGLAQLSLEIAAINNTPVNKGIVQNILNYQVNN